MMQKYDSAKHEHGSQLARQPAATSGGIQAGTLIIVIVQSAKHHPKKNQVKKEITLSPRKQSFDVGGGGRRDIKRDLITCPGYEEWQKITLEIHFSYICMEMIIFSPFFCLY